MARRKTLSGAVEFAPITSEEEIKRIRDWSAWLLAAADRLEHGELSGFDAQTLAMAVRRHATAISNPKRPRGQRQRFDAGEMALRYAELVLGGTKPAEAIGVLADEAGVSEEAVRNANAPMRDAAVSFLRLLRAQKPKR